MEKEKEKESRLIGWEIHGFRTIEDLDVESMMKEAKSRWFRSNEIHAMLSNHTFFHIMVKPLNLPKGGTIVFFDRKKLRNFRKDGHSWKKKKDGRTVKEAHEHLKIGAEEKIHVYYAHGEDNKNFVRRCYWLLDKTLEHIVLVHYRENQEGSPVMPVNSDFSSDLSDPSASRLLSGGSNHQINQVYYNAPKERIESGESVNASGYDMKLHEINTLEWDELLVPNTNEAMFPAKGNTSYTQQYDQYAAYNLEKNGSNLLTSQIPSDMLTPMSSMDPRGTSSAYISQSDLREDNQSYDLGTGGAGAISHDTVKDGLQSQDSFGRWISDIMVESPESVDEPYIESSVATSHGSFSSSGVANQEGSLPKQIFCITDVSPTWACSTEKTKILVVGFFHQDDQHLAKSNVFCVCGDICVPAEIVQVGVFRCWISPHNPGLVTFYLSFDGRSPISQVLTVEFRSHALSEATEHQPQWDMFRIQMRLAHLLVSTSKNLGVLSSKVSQNAVKTCEKFSSEYLNVVDGWVYFAKLIAKGDIPFERAMNSLFEFTMKSKLKEWLLERIVDGSKTSERDAQGQGVLHLCAILGYTWAVYPISFAGLSLDFRDKFGWTALHWAAYFGREKMVATLVSAGANSYLVTDPTSEKPEGCTTADLASKQGFDGLAAYLSEKSLIQQFEDMKLAGNVGGSLETPSLVNLSNDSEEEMYLKETLAAYRTAADAATRIQVAFRERAFKERSKAAQGSNQEDEARCVIAALKIQHAFKNYEKRKKMIAASRIQYRFRTWKVRKEFLYMRQQAIKIQAAFRSYQVRMQHQKLVWSVGVLEKAVLRWLMKKNGLRGLHIETKEPAGDQRQESDTEEDFYRASRKQAEERVEKAVVRVQAMFRSRKAQQEYRRMKLAQLQAELENEKSDYTVEYEESSYSLEYEESNYPHSHPS